MNKYCKLQTYYDKKFKRKITILKICDRLFKVRNEEVIQYSKIDKCPFCGNQLV